MKVPRMILFWTGVIGVLLLVEVLEITHAFTVPFTQAIVQPYAFALAVVFTTILALVGAIFIGIYISQRLLSPRGFSIFEEEMLKMRSEVSEIRRALDVLTRRDPDPPPGAADPVSDEPRPPVLR